MVQRGFRRDASNDTRDACAPFLTASFRVTAHNANRPLGLAYDHGHTNITHRAPDRVITGWRGILLGRAWSASSLKIHLAHPRRSALSGYGAGRNDARTAVAFRCRARRARIPNTSTALHRLRCRSGERPRLFTPGTAGRRLRRRIILLISSVGTSRARGFSFPNSITTGCRRAKFAESLRG